MTETTMTADDFVTGILAGLTLRGWSQVDVTNRRFDQVLTSLYEYLASRAEELGLDLDFQISPDPIHGDSAVIDEALSVAVQGRVVGRVNPSFRRLRLYLSEDRARRLLDLLPGGPTLFSDLTDRFIQDFDSVPA